MNADVEIFHLSTPEDCRALCRLLADVWGLAEDTAVASSDTLRAMAHSGCYVVGVRVAGQLVGGGFGWPTRVGGEWRLHSHVIGFLDGYRALGLGARNKHHQRDFARQHGLAAVEWTYDPLLAANASFNLAKLGARVESFHHDFYGEMQDTFSAGLGSDRFLVSWAVDDQPAQITDDAVPAVLVVGEAGEPVVLTIDAPSVRAQIPGDIVHIRQHDKALALAWRDAFESTVGAEVQSGARITGFAPNGWYHIAR